ncbi:MAG: hypothetical protein JWN24_2897 [Phycisphaerales bacterium]|nr:hypothetical protein [Phycisphaerales bacterium]
MAPLTVLIWVYAEREQTDSKVSVTLRIEVKNTDPGYLIQLRDTDGHVHPSLPVHVDLSGPHARVEEVRQKLETAGTAVAVDVDTKVGLGIHSISLGMLSNDPLFVKSGVTVAAPIPREVEVSIDKMIQRDVEVKIDPKVTNVEATFEPRKVRVSGSEAVLRNPALVAYAQIPDQKEPGSRDISGVDVVLQPIGDSHVTISPPTVMAKVEVKDPDVVGTVNAMPVWAVYPPGAVWDKFKPEFEQTIAGVQVRGPAEKISRVNDADFEFKPKAYLNLSTAVPAVGAAPAAGQRYTAQLEIVFPSNSGLRVSPDDTHKTISFTLVERKLSE